MKKSLKSHFMKLNFDWLSFKSQRAFALCNLILLQSFIFVNKANLADFSLFVFLLLVFV